MVMILSGLKMIFIWAFIKTFTASRDVPLHVNYKRKLEDDSSEASTSKHSAPNNTLDKNRADILYDKMMLGNSIAHKQTKHTNSVSFSSKGNMSPGRRNINYGMETRIVLENEGEAPANALPRSDYRSNPNAFWEAVEMGHGLSDEATGSACLEWLCEVEGTSRYAAVHGKHNLDSVSNQTNLTNSKNVSHPKHYGELLGNTSDIPNKEVVMSENTTNSAAYYQDNPGNVSSGDSPYEYSNAKFISNFTSFPSSIFTYGSIKTRFRSGLLSLLSIDEFVGVLVALMSNELKISNTGRATLLEMMFGHADCDLEMNFTTRHIVNIVRSILQSEIHHCFEQVFLTCKMWRRFTPQEQDEMIEDVLAVDGDGDGYERLRRFQRETLVMLYLFVLNKGSDNSDMCERLKTRIMPKKERRKKMFVVG